MITSETEISTCIDWLSVTFDKLDYPSNWSTERKELDYGMLRYDTATQYLDGRIELSSSVRKDMGIHVIFGGKTITRLCADHNITSFDLLSVIGQGKCSRIDVALDIKHGSIAIDGLTKAIKNGEHTTGSKSFLHLDQIVERGETLYVGSKQSKTRARIYDKQAEANTDYEWTRIEMQYRHENAKRAYQSVASAENAHSRVPAMINQFISFPHSQDWTLALGSDSIKLPPRERPESNRKKWLLETATRALAKEMLEGGVNILEEFTTLTIDRYDTLRSEFK